MGIDGRIDAHQHFWRYAPEDHAWIDPASVLARDYGPQELEKALRAAGLAGSIAVQARESEEETLWLLELAQTHPWIAGVIGWTDLTADRAANRIAALAAAPKLLGFRHFVQAEPDPLYLLRADFQRGIGAVLAAGLTYDLLIRAPQLEHLPAFLDAVLTVGEGAIVIDHGAKPAIAEAEWEPWAGRIAAVARDYPVFCKISGLVTEACHADWSERDVLRYMDHLLDRFGADRLIFGSDWPVCQLAAPYARVHALVEQAVAQLSAEEQAAIWGGNARRAYRRLALQDQGEAVP
ncbi:MAG: amidohydrolase 2 [Novosphingobium lindaniclasticum]|uniref:amidohydrolase family protein n=1 Tax=Novosphingobium lindaniclasticum TaxID=1329895 RepID=UPI00240947D2|nr:amidohydrolase family protein [Novosphingobium lindaniclasticum]MDF2640488.1 amidohydrolase 2 [Novosphingobium lindaniclasticum]